MTVTVEKVQPEISLIDGERCTHEWGIDEDGDARILCSVKTSLKCDSCGEVYCAKHLALHKRYYCTVLAWHEGRA